MENNKKNKNGFYITINISVRLVNKSDGKVPNFIYNVGTTEYNEYEE